MVQTIAIVLMLLTLGAVKLKAFARKQFTPADLVKHLEDPAPNKPNKAARQVTQLYQCPPNDELSKIIALEGTFLDTGDDGDVFRIVHLDEMINPRPHLGSDFVAIGLVPLIDSGDNIFLVYQVATKRFGLCDISDLDENDDADPLFEIYTNAREYIKSKL